MKTLDDVLDAALKKIGKESDRQLSIALGVTASTLSNWRTRKSTPDAYGLMELQKILGIDAREILAIIEAERAKTEERRSYWEEIKAGFSKSGTSIAVAIALAAMMTSSPRPAEASTKMECKLTKQMYIMLSTILQFANWLMRQTTPKTAQKYFFAQC